MRPVRGSIVWVDQGFGSGSEQNKRRPAIVVSNDGANHSAWRGMRGVITVVPLTSSERPPYPFQVAVPAKLSGLAHQSIAQAEQVRSVDVNRVTPTACVLGAPVMEELKRALVLHLGLWA